VGFLDCDMTPENPEVSEVWAAACEALEWGNVARERGVRDSVLDVDGVSEGVGPVRGVQICSREHGAHHVGKCAVRSFGNCVLEG